MAPARKRGGGKAKTSSAGGSDKYSKLKYKRNEEKMTYVTPSAGTNLTTDNVIKFSFRSPPGEYISFPANPLAVLYDITYKNPDYDPTEEDDAEKRMLRLNARAMSQDPRIFLEPTLGATGFFTTCEVQIDKQWVGLADIQGENHFYQNFNRKACNDEYFESTYGHKRLVVHTSESYRVKKSLKPEGDLDEVEQLQLYQDLAASCDFDKGGTDSPRLSLCSFDSAFPLVRQNNTLACYRKKKYKEAFFLPGTEFTISLMRRDRPDEIIQRADLHPVSLTWPLIKGKTYATTATDYVMNNDLKVNLRNVALRYKSVKPMLPGLRPNTAHRFYVDIPKYQQQAMMHGVLTTVNRFPLPAYTQLVYIYWPTDHNLIFNPAKQKPQTVATSFPDRMSSLKIYLEGNESSALQLFNLHLTKANWSMNNRTYHEELVKKGILSCKLEEIFPRRDNHLIRSLSQFIILPLDQYVIEEGQGLVVEANFPDNPRDLTLEPSPGSPKGHFVCIFTLQQFLFSQDVNKLWHYSLAPL